MPNLGILISGRSADGRLKMATYALSSASIKWLLGGLPRLLAASKNKSALNSRPTIRIKLLPEHTAGSGRVGPHEEEMDGLREPSEASAAGFVLKNQTVFVRTLNFNLK